MSFRKYEEYKESGIEWLGEVPEHWEITQIKYVAQINPSKSELKTIPLDTPVTFLPMESIGGTGGLDIRNSKPLSEVVSAGYTYLAENDVIIAKITPCFENGKGAIATGLLNGIAFATTEVVTFRCFRVNNQYLYFLLSSSPFRKIAEGSMYGAGGQKRVSETFFSNYKCCIPPTNEEQKQIAVFLDKETTNIDTLVDKQEQLITLLREKRQAIIAHAVTRGLDPNAKMKDSGIEWLGEVPEHWEVSLLKRRYQVTLGKMLKSKQTSPDETEEPYLRAANIHWRGVDKTDVKRMWFTPEKKKKLKLYRDDLLVSEGGDVGRSSLWNDEIEGCYIQNSINRIRAREDADTRFLFYWMYFIKHADYIDMICNKATIAHFTVEKVEATPCVYPPIEEQKQIVAFLDKETTKIDTLIEKCETAIELLKERRTALISAAVTGKIDVRDVG